MVSAGQWGDAFVVAVCLKDRNDWSDCLNGMLAAKNQYSKQNLKNSIDSLKPAVASIEEEGKFKFKFLDEPKFSLLKNQNKKIKVKYRLNDIIIFDHLEPGKEVGEAYFYLDDYEIFRTKIVVE